MGKDVSLSARHGRRMNYFSAWVRQGHRLENGSRIPIRTARGEHALDDPLYMLEHMVRHRLAQTAKMDTTRKTVHNKTQTLSPLETLSIFKDAMREDEFAIRFDMISFNLICVQLMRIVQAGLPEISGRGPTAKWPMRSKLLWKGRNPVS